MEKVSFSVARPLGLLLITGKKESTVPLTTEESLKSVLIVQTTKPVTNLISRQWLSDASMRRATRNALAQFRPSSTSTTDGDDENDVPPPINYIGVIFRPLVYVKAIDMKDRSEIQSSNVKMIDAIVNTLAFTFGRVITKYAKGEKTQMEKDNVDLYYHVVGKFRSVVSNATKGASIALSFYNMEVLAELLKLDSSLNDKGIDVKVNKGSDTVHLFFYYDRKKERSVWKDMPARGTVVAPGGITRRVDNKKSKGSATVAVPVVDYSLYEVDYDSPGIFMNPLVNTLARKELAVVEVALSSIGLDPHSFSSYEMTTNNGSQADVSTRNIKHDVCVSIGREHKFDFDAIQPQCCLYDQAYIKMASRMISSIEATGLMEATEATRKQKQLGLAQKKADAEKAKRDLDSLKTPEERHKEIYDPSVSVSYYDDTNTHIRGEVKVESVMRFARKITEEELIRSDHLDTGFDRKGYERMVLEMYGPDDAFY